jgi:hypothetical protein
MPYDDCTTFGSSLDSRSWKLSTPAARLRHGAEAPPKRSSLPPLSPPPRAYTPHHHTHTLATDTCTHARRTDDGEEVDAGEQYGHVLGDDGDDVHKRPNHDAELGHGSKHAQKANGTAGNSARHSARQMRENNAGHSQLQGEARVTTSHRKNVMMLVPDDDAAFFASNI